MADREQMVINLLCGELQTSWSFCDTSCDSCKFYHEESDMGARVSICVHGFGSSKESCGCYMTQHEYFEFMRSGFANLKAENAKLRGQVTQLQSEWESERDYADQMEAKEKMAVAENDKLREFAQAMTEFAYKCQMLCIKCRFVRECYNSGEKKEHEGRGCQWWLWARELGIKVEDD